MTRFSSGRAVVLGVALALVLIAAGAIVGLRRDRPVGIAYAGTPVDPPKAASDFVLTDASDRAAHVLDRTASIEFLFFGYTHCPDSCPIAMASLGRAYRSLAPAERAHVRVVFVTVDPERDRVPVVKRYVHSFDADFVGLTGTHAQLAPVWNAYGVTVDPATKEIAHGDAIYAIDANGKVVLVYPADTRSTDLAKDARSFGL